MKINSKVTHNQFQLCQVYDFSISAAHYFTAITSKTVNSFTPFTCSCYTLAPQQIFLYVSAGIERLIQEEPCSMCRRGKAVCGKTDLASKHFELLLVVVVVVVPHYITIHPENSSKSVSVRIRIIFSSSINTN